MATVIDASVMAALLLPDEDNRDVAGAILEQLDTGGAIVPGIFWYEIRNVLIQAKRRQRIGQQDFEDCLVQLRDEFLPSVDSEHEEAKTLDLAQRYNLSIYDAAYLETAIRRGAELATFDGKLAKAAAKESIANPALL